MLDTASFVARFFSAPNELSVEQFTASSALGKVVQPWLKDAKLGDRHLFLPYRFGGATAWYAIADSARGERELLDLLRAFLGPSLADFDGISAQLDAKDPVEAAVLAFRGGRCYRLRSLPGREEAFVRAACRLMALLGRRPPQRAIGAKPLGQLIQTLELALVSGNEIVARTTLAELEADGRLNRANRAFLRVRFLHRFHRLPEVLSVFEREGLLVHPRPAEVTRIGLEAVYALYLEKFEREDDPRGAVEKFHVELFSKYRPLFVSTPGPGSSAGYKALVVRAVAERDDERVTRILAAPELTGAVRDWCERLSSVLQPQVSTPAAGSRPATGQTAYERAQAAFERDDYDVALAELSRADATIHGLRLVTEVAFWDKSLRSLRAALDMRKRATAEAVEEVFGNRRYSEMWSAIASLHEAAVVGEDPTRPCDSWRSWLRRILDDGPWSSMEAEARAGSEEWTIDHEEGAALGPLLFEVAAREELRSRVVASLPFALNSLRRGHVSLSARRDAYQSLLMILEEERAITQPLLEVAHELAEDSIAAGLGPYGYDETLRVLQVLWERAKSDRTTDWALDLIDALIANPCADSAARGSLVQAVGAFFMAQPGRREMRQWSLFRALAADAGEREYGEQVFSICPWQGPTPARDPFDWMKGKRFAVYTLEEQAAQRARDFVLARLPGLSFDLNHDHVGSDRLKSLCQSADYFLVVAGSAKHAATGFISQNLPSEKEPIWVCGKGSSSILRTLQEIGRKHNAA